MHRIAVLILPVLLLLSGTSSGAQDPAALAVKVQARYENIKAIQADYTRESHFTAIAGQAARTVKGSGMLIYSRPLSLRLDQAEPRKELIVTTSDGVWWSRPKKKRAELYPLQSFTTGLRPLLDALSGLASVDQSFAISAPSAEEAALGKGEHVLVLTPQKTRADLKKLIVRFGKDDLVLSGFRIINLVGDVTDYRLMNLKTNPQIPAGTFAFQPPQGYRIRDHRPLSMRQSEEKKP